MAQAEHTRQRALAPGNSELPAPAAVQSSGPSQANSRQRSESGFLLDLKPIDPSAASQPAGIIVYYSPGRPGGG